MEVFATAQQAQYQPPDPHNHGRMWTLSAKAEVLHDFDIGCTLHTLCDKHGRSGNSILAVLTGAGVVMYDSVKNTYFYKEKQMSTTVATPKADKIIETVVMIRGHNAASFSDDAIFKLIADLEVEADTLSKIKNKPRKLGAKIDGIHADIKKLIEYVDAR